MTLEVKVNEGEKWTSDDPNKMQLYAEMERNQLAALLMSQGGSWTDGFFAGAGLVTSAGSLVVDVAQGVGMFFDATPAADEPPYQRVYIPAAQQLTLATADPANPRIDVIAVQPAVVEEDASNVYIKDPASGVITFQSLEKTRRSESSTSNSALVVITGTPGMSPSEPAHTGYIALASVYVPAAAASITDANILDRRVVHVDRRVGAHAILNGLSVDYKDATTVTVRKGSAYVNGQFVQVASDTDLDLSAAADREQGVSEAASTWYYVYLIAGDRRDNSSGYELKITTKAPGVDGRPGSAMTPTAAHNNMGLTEQNGCLFLGSFRNDGSSNILPYTRAGERVIYYDTQLVPGGAIGPGGPTNLSLAAVVPASVRSADFEAVITNPNAVTSILMLEPNGAAGTGHVLTVDNNSGAPLSWNQVLTDVPLIDQTVDYTITGAGTSLTLRVASYTERLPR